MKSVLVSLCFVALAAGLPAGAQSQPKTIARINTIKVKPGEAQEWEAGTKRLNAWKRERNGPVATYIWSVISGENQGEYVEGNFGRDWKDFDAGKERGVRGEFMKEVQATVVPYTESYESSFYAFQPDLSSPVEAHQPPPPMSEITFFILKPGGMQAVVNAIKEANAAIKKTHWTGNGSGAEWYVLVDGGEVPQIVLAIGLKNWAAMQSPSPSLGDILAKVYGKPGAQAILQSFDSHVRREYNELIRYRPDLSYIPAKQ